MTIIEGYQYEIWFDSNCIRDRTGDDEEIYETKEEAMDEAQSDIEDIIRYHEGYGEEDREYFDIRLCDVL